MDKQSPSQNTEQKDNAAQLIENMTHAPQESRFSRRRFLQTGVAVSPLLMTVKSPVAWGCNTQTNGTANAHTSGNTSAAIGAITKLKKLTAQQWDDIFCGCYTRESLQTLLGTYLGYFGITNTTQFYQLLAGLTACNTRNNTWKSCNNTWKYQIYISNSHNPSINQVLGGSSREVKIRFRRHRRNRTYKYRTVSMSQIGLHRDVTCAYLNSVAADGNFVDWHTTKSMVLSDVNVALNAAARACVDGSGVFTSGQIARARRKLVNHLAHYRA